MEKQNIIKQLNDLKEKTNSLWESFEIDKNLDQLQDMEKQMSSSGFWNDKDKANQIIEDMADLKLRSNSIVEVRHKIEDSLELLELDIEIDSEFIKEIEAIKKEFKNLEVAMLLNEEHDKANVFLEIHSGAGGTEACDWAEILFRMYSRYAEANNFNYEILSYLPGEEAGLKSVTMHIKGKFAYAYLKNEKGIHRLVRLSPFDSNKRRHTSFASVEVVPEIDAKIEVEINEKDLRIDVFRSSGKGGQGVNTTDSAVRITHLPTGIVISCQNERSQIQNKEQAMKVLKNKLYILEEQKKREEINKLKGDFKDIEFGSQIRSYVLHPYSMVKDHRTGAETSNVEKVLDGDINIFIEASLKS